MRKLFQASVLAYLFCVGSIGGLGQGKIQKGCSPSSCGKLRDIRYPFRLKDDPPNCGDPRYELTCDANRTILDFLSGKYYVEDISYGLQGEGLIRVTDVGLAGGKCGALPSQTLSPDTPSGDEGFLIWSRWWASFVECRQDMGSNEKYWPIPCLDGNGTFVYVVFEYQLAYLAEFCRFLAMVPSDFGDELEGATVYEALQWGFFLVFRTCSTGSVSQMIIQCFPEAWWQHVVEINHPSVFALVSTPLSYQMEFLTCLHHQSNNFCLSYATFVFGVVLATLIEVIVLVVLARLLIRIVFGPLILSVLLAYKYYKSRVPIDEVEKFLSNQQSLTPTRYSYTDIITMTRHFKEKLGQGGFGSVYKGVLPGSVQVAVKVLGNSKCNGDDFISEVSTIGRIHHVNVVRLIGYSSEGSKRALVYEYLPKGSLDKYIFSSNATVQRPFTWDKLVDIALGVARGIDYLHQGCDMRILHFDIKPHNILLDNFFNPKVSDFGLAKLFPKEYSIVALSIARGTIGYIAPELISRSFGVISYKSDVYSFGMLLMEMAGGRRNVEPKAKNTSQVYYPSWIYDQINPIDNQNSEVHGIVDDVNPVGETERKLSIVGLWCIQTRPSERPSMNRVIEMLQSEVDTLEVPPKPFLSAETIKTISVGDLSMEPASISLSTVSEH